MHLLVCLLSWKQSFKSQIVRDVKIENWSITYPSSFFTKEKSINHWFPHSQQWDSIFSTKRFYDNKNKQYKKNRGRMSEEAFSVLYSYPSYYFIWIHFLVENAHPSPVKGLQRFPYVPKVQWIRNAIIVCQRDRPVMNVVCLLQFNGTARSCCVCVVMSEGHRVHYTFQKVRQVPSEDLAAPLLMGIWYLIAFVQRLLL